ncbi:MAG TPA: hypothetical protein VD997_16550 [Phycisphaerales bacterium]|nr:hypothetical protein [Phycisphaerales bacterium]
MRIKAGLATIVGAAALLSVGCTENRTLRGYDDMHDNRAWAPYVSEYGPNTGVTGSSASPYVGGGIINQKPDPVGNPAVEVHRTTTTIDRDGVDVDVDTNTTTTTIRRD